MTPAELIADLARQGVELWRDGDKLKFRAPQGALRPEQRQRLQANKTALLEALSAPKLRPLGLAQERLLFLQGLDPDCFSYTIPIRVELTGPLDRSALTRALNEIVRRHETLRSTFDSGSTFDSDGGEPRQRIHPFRSFDLAAVDLAALPEPEREAERLRRTRREIETPFDLARGPLYRFVLFRLDAGRHVLLAVLHHLISDGWSLQVLYRELATLYEAFVAGRSSPLPPLAVQYGDFAVRQRQWLRGDEARAQLAYWRERLADLPPALDLPGRPRTAPPARGRWHVETFPPELLDALRRLSREANVTLYMTLLAAFQVLLHRYAGATDIVTSSPVAGRTRAEVEGLIGFFVNTLILRGDLAGDPPFDRVLAAAKTATLEAQQHQDLPFDRIVEELRSGDFVRSPFYQVMLSVQDTTLPPQRVGDLVIAAENFDSGSAKLDLFLALTPTEHDLKARFEYDTDRFDEPAITTLAAHFRKLLEQIAQDPRRSISEYALWTEHEAHALPDPAAPLAGPPQPLAADVFRERVRAAPNSIAVAQGDRAWTYAELDARADACARALVAAGLEKGDVVAIEGRRCFAMVPAVLGVMRSGGVFLLSDPWAPDARRRVVLEQARARWAVFTSGADAWPADYDGFRARLSLDPATGEVDALADLPLPALADADPAYIFFTSGSTGVPKGVLSPHRGLTHFIRWQGETFGVTPQDRVAQLTAPSFDPILRDLFLPLLHGATLCLPDTAGPLPPNPLAWLENAGVTLLHTVPALARNWLAAASDDERPRRLRCTFFAGEPLTAALVEAWRRQCPGSEIVNLYGLTETTLARCYYRVPDPPAPGVQPIGRSLPDSQILILAGKDCRCGFGETGQIVLRTPFHTYGYVQDHGAPDGQGFLPNPFRDDPDDLVFSTGDLGRYRPDGEVEILGRIDRQVKIRGVRVEPDEVSLALAAHPDVAACHVDVWHPAPDDPERKELAAYVVARREGLEPDALLAFLRERLPPAYLPSAFHFLAALPLMPSGKVDRQALRAAHPPAVHSPDAGLESAVAAIFADALDRETVASEDDFFRLGGHSLLAMRVVSRLRKSLGVEIPVRAFFDHSTPAALAGLIREARPEVAQIAVESALPPAAGNGAGALSRAPENSLERIVVGIFGEVLATESVGVEDNFFLIGGHSLLAMQAVNRIRGALAVDVPLKQFFETPTAAQLAEWLGEAEPADDGLEDLLAEIEGLSDEEAARLAGGGP